MTTADAVARARPIELIVFDVDGVLTDGKLWYFPTGADGGVTEVKGFSAHDGIGIGLARRAGLKVGVVTKRTSQSVALRMRDLRVDYVYQGIDRKFEALREIWAASGFNETQTCCMGDDIVDLPMINRSGLAAAPANARPEVLKAAHFVAEHAGGEGAARDLVEFILKSKGIWERVMRQWLAAPESDYAKVGAAPAPAPPDEISQ
jgi:3-deoxy-D-manno-octulosonate 8-phosphate phosphatase (KDO 8-P phosphatase)